MQQPAWLIGCFMGIITLFIIAVFLIVKQCSIKQIRVNARKITLWFLIWVLIQIIFSVSGLYSAYTKAMPPKIILFGILPALIGLGLLFYTKKGKCFIQSLPTEYLVNAQIFRIPVEFMLAALFFEKLVPKQMTFFGSNFDIVIGITAPLIAYLFFNKHKISRLAILVWNFLGVFFLFHIVLIAFLSAPSPMQQINFKQPNVAILHYPFALLATVIVPMLLFFHLVCIKRFWVSKNEDDEATVLASQIYITAVN